MHKNRINVELLLLLFKWWIKGVYSEFYGQSSLRMMYIQHINNILLAKTLTRVQIKTFD